jgi:hypothetical protein
MGCDERYAQTRLPRSDALPALITLAAGGLTPSSPPRPAPLLGHALLAVAVFDDLPLAHVVGDLDRASMLPACFGPMDEQRVVVDAPALVGRVGWRPLGRVQLLHRG